MSLIDSLEERLIRLLSPILRPIRGLVSIFTKFKDNTVGILDAATHLIQSATDEYEKIKDFSLKPEWKHRVISPEKVIENIQALIEVPRKVLAAFNDLVNQLRGKLAPEAFNVDELEGIEDLRGLFTKLGSRLARGFEKVLGIITLVVDALVSIRSTIDDLQSIVDSIETVRKDLEGFDLLFLPQNNKRKTVTAKSVIRVGALHSGGS